MHARDIMTTRVVTTHPDARIAVVAREMLTNRRRCVPIIDGTRLVGVITRRDVVRVLARSDEDMATDVRKHLLYLGGSSRWMVQVVNGEAHLRDNFQDSSDRFVAVHLAEAVPGVIRASAVSRDPDTRPRRTSPATSVALAVQEPGTPPGPGRER